MRESTVLAGPENNNNSSGHQRVSQSSAGNQPHLIQSSNANESNSSYGQFIPPPSKTGSKISQFLRETMKHYPMYGKKSNLMNIKFKLNKNEINEY